MEGNKYVTDDVFRSEIRRIEQQVENAVERIELKMDVYTAQMDGRVSRIEGKFDRLEASVNGRVNTIEAKVDTLAHFVGWVIGLTAIVVAVSAIFIPLLK